MFILNILAACDQGSVERPSAPTIPKRLIQFRSRSVKRDRQTAMFSPLSQQGHHRLARFDTAPWRGDIGDRPDGEEVVRLVLF